MPATLKKGGKKGKDKNNDVIALVEDRIAEFTTTMSTLTGRAEHMDKYIKELEFVKNIEELHGAMQAAMIFVVVDIHREIQAI